MMISSPLSMRAFASAAEIFLYCTGVLVGVGSGIGAGTAQAEKVSTESARVRTAKTRFMINSSNKREMGNATPV
jgi:hypothetical protein